MGEYSHISHTFLPVFDENSELLILGSFPSVKSREQGFYYGHPQNRIWKLMAKLLNTDVPNTIEGKKAFLLNNHIALWDVIASCEIENSADSTIRNAVPNDLDEIFARADIRAVYTNGKTADKLYRKYHAREAVCLPSTSPANAAFSMDRLEHAWKIIFEGKEEAYETNRT